MALTLEQFGQKIKTKYPQYASMPDAEVGKKVLEKYPEYSDMVSAASSSSSTMTQAPKPSTKERAINLGKDLLTGAAKGAGNTVVSIGQLGSGLLEKGYNASIGRLTNKPAASGGALASEVKQQYLTPSNPAQAFGFGAEQVGELFVPVPGLKAAKAATAAKTAKSLAEAPRLSKALSVAGRVASEGVEQGARALAQEGQVNNNVKLSTLLGAASPAIAGTVGKGAEKVSDFFYSRTVPTTIKEAAKDFSKNLNIGRALSESGISATRGSLLSKVRSEANALGNKLDDTLKAYASANPDDTFKISKIVSDIESSFDDRILAKTMKASPVDAKAIREAITQRLDEYKKLYADQPLNIVDLQRIKVDLGDGLERVYKQALDAPIKAKAFTDMQVQSALRNIIKQKAPQIDEINKALAPLLEGERRMLSKGAYSGYLTDLLAGGFAAGTVSDFMDDPTRFAKNFVTGVILKRLGTSTAAKTTAGTLTRAVSDVASDPKLLQALRRAISPTKPQSK